MFSFDPSDLPLLTTRKALLVVDFQNDFLLPGSAWSVEDAGGLVSRTVGLASHFRNVGEVVWVQSQYSEPRSAEREVPRPKPSQMSAAEQDVNFFADAFLAGRNSEPDQPQAVEPGTEGCELHEVAARALGENPRDMKFTKTHYSAFKTPELLQRLRGKFVTELYICGSLTNMGVYATAIEAGGHGNTIHIVQDCCGYRDKKLHETAISWLVEMTGCEVVDSPQVIDSLASATSAAPSDMIKSMADLSIGRPTRANKATKPEPESESVPEPRGVVESPDKSTKPRSSSKGAASSAKAKEGESQYRPGKDESAEGSSSPDALCEGDTMVIQDLLPESAADDMFARLKDEVQWQRMAHQGGEVPRLVAVQGAVEPDGCMPVYRHPADSSPPLLPFSPAVLEIKAHVEKHLGHPLNHALIQFYRDGTDYISEHSDKTLDIVRGSFIANVSLGAERTMVLRTKRVDKDPSRIAAVQEEGKARKVIRVKLPHNSLCRMGLQTNMRWLHAIRQDKRADREKTEAELAYSKARISLTFRQIGTFLDKDETVIWGQGATSKNRQGARPVNNGQTPESIRMLQAFGTENHASSFDWDEHYGKGFDVLHMKCSPRLFTGADMAANLRVGIMLAECGVSYAKGSNASAAPTTTGQSALLSSRPITFSDVDEAKSVVEGEVAIMLYLDTYYVQGRAERSQADMARQLSRFQLGLTMLHKWRASAQDETTKKGATKQLKQDLTILDGFASQADFLAGSVPSIADFAVWPAIYSVISEAGGDEVLKDFEGLRKWYDAFESRESVQKMLARS